MKRWSGLFVFIALSGCTHVSHREKIDEQIAPPSREWVKSIRLQGLTPEKALPSMTEGQSWWMTYQEARALEKSQALKACEKYLSLSQKKDFPLWDLAWARSQLVCESMDPTYTDSPTAKNIWYTSVNILIRERQVALTTDLKDDVDLLIEKSKHETLPKKKEGLILEAYKQAQKTDDPELLAAIENRLSQVFPRYQKNPPPKAWLEVAADFRQFRKFEQAQKFYEAVLRKGDLEAQWNAWKGLRQILKTKQDREGLTKIDNKIQNWLAKVLKKNKTSTWVKRWHDHSLMQIRQLWTEDQYQTAYKKLTRATVTFHNLYPRDELFFVLARMEEERSHLVEAQKYLSLSLKEKESLPGLREKVLWSSAWLYYKQKNYAEALRRLEENLNLPNLEPASRYKYLFWKARSQTRLSSKESTSTYESLAQEDPLGFYGLLSYYDRSLSLPALAVGAGKNLNLSLSSLHEVPLSSGLKLDWLISLDEKEVLEEALKNTLESIKSFKNLTDEGWLKIFSAFAQAQLYLPLFSNLNKIKPEIRDQLLRTHPELIFARPYDDFVLPSAKKAGISPWFIYSIMRQESAFNPEARSGVDAMGLLQLMPDLAHKLSRNNGIQFNHAEELFEPEINISLGALELKNLLNSYKENYILAVAAYNANGKAISGWLKTRLRQDPIEFIEEIPYEETRAYIKLVFRNFVFYQRLDQASQETPFPTELLSWPPK